MWLTDQRATTKTLHDFDNKNTIVLVFGPYSSEVKVVSITSVDGSCIVVAL